MIDDRPKLSLVSKFLADGRDPGVRSWRKRAHRGVLLIELGLVEHGLDELLRAQVERDRELGASGEAGMDASGEQASNSYWLEAQIAEARRSYLRDVVLSDPDRTHELPGMLEQAKAGFRKALHAAGPEGAPSAALAWIHAHLGAACMLLFFLQSLVPGQGLVEFQQADRHFKKALKLLAGDYPWCRQMQAFLYTLRGRCGQGEDDFAAARSILDAARAPGLDSVLDRNRAMLSSFRAAADEGSLGEREAAAGQGLEHGLRAVQLDSEDFVAAYFAAVNFDWLAKHASDGRCADYAAGRDAAVASARVRATNAISQATAILAGLDLLAGKRESAEALLRDFAQGRSRIDLESWGIFLRDPAWRGLLPEARRIMSDKLALNNAEV